MKKDRVNKIELIGNIILLAAALIYICAMTYDAWRTYIAPCDQVRAARLGDIPIRCTEVKSVDLEGRQ